MEKNQFLKTLNKIEQLKKKLTNIESFKIDDLQKLPVLTGIIELQFQNNFFYMININNDDATVLKYLWRNNYEPFSLELWYKITRNDEYFFDVGAHTGIYSIIGNLNKKGNQIISIEPYFLNYARLLSNLRLNKISNNNCFLAALSNTEGEDSFMIQASRSYLTQGGQISKKGNLKIIKKKIDNFILKKKVGAIKIDTEGHEYEIIEGGINTIKKNQPEIIIEMNETSLENCIKILEPLKYKFYFIDERNKKLKLIDKQCLNYNKSEGKNCIATCKKLMD